MPAILSYTSKNGRTMEPLAYYKAFTEQPYTQATGSAIINPPSNAADFTRFYSENIVKFVLGQQDLNETTWADFRRWTGQPGCKRPGSECKNKLFKEPAS